MSNDHYIAAALAKALALACVRNTFLEDLHAGKSPDSKTGDYSDVKVVTPYGEIPWNNVSRISDDEMKTLMQEVVNKLYTFLLCQNEPKFITALDQLASRYVQKWDEPELLTDFILRKPD
jgi:hypothetical protein